MEAKREKTDERENRKAFFFFWKTEFFLFFPSSLSPMHRPAFCVPQGVDRRNLCVVIFSASCAGARGERRRRAAPKGRGRGREKKKKGERASTTKKITTSFLSLSPIFLTSLSLSASSTMASLAAFKPVAIRSVRASRASAVVPVAAFPSKYVP